MIRLAKWIREKVYIFLAVIGVFLAAIFDGFKDYDDFDDYTR